MQKNKEIEKPIPRLEYSSLQEKKELNQASRVFKCDALKPKKLYSRKEYLESLLPSLGKLLTQGLRAVENLKRDLQDWRKN